MEKAKGYNNAVLKTKNRGQVFKQLVTNNGIYRTELAEECGLTKMAISYIVNEFIEKDIAVESFRNEEKKPGRRSGCLRLSPGAKKVIGLLIHRNYISVTLCDCQLHVLRADTIRFEECDTDFLLKKAFELTDEMMEENEILGIGIGSIGPVSSERGIILNPPEFYGIKNVPIVQLFEERYGLPVYLDYHYNCAARAEKYFGMGKKYKNFILLGITDGIGIAIVVDGKIFTRMTGTSSELGHITVDYSGRQCFCGRRGCLGAYMDFSSKETTWQSVEILCAALAGVCDLLIPQAVIVRDEQSYLENEHLEWMEKELNQKIIARDYQRIAVCKSCRSKELEATGCAANVLGRVFSGEIEI
ncbi:MAG: ROK family protein [Roseburia sp.]|nr:ROK family protein [Roseburia sp.]